MQQWLRSSKFLLIFLPIWLFVLSWIRPLSVPDEGRYGDISRSMFESGDWLIPRINSLPFMHKPPLLHWLSSIFMELFGMHIWVLRLVPVLAGTLMLVSLFLFVRKHISERVAQLTAVILGTNLLFFGSSEYINHDLLLASWITVSVLCFVDFTISARKSILFLGYFAGAAAFLSKGLIGVLIPGMILLPWLLYTKQWKKIPSLLNPFAILFFILLVSPWLYAVQSKYPQFLHYFFIDQQFSRFSSKEFNNKQPWCFYLIILMFSFLPWILSSRFQSIKAVFQNYKQSALLALLVWWFISVTVFFSIPPSKLAGYILPAVPPLAIFLALVINQVIKSDYKTKLQVWGLPIFIMLVGIGITATPHFIRTHQPFFQSQALFIYIIGTLLIVLPLALVWLYKKQKLNYLNYIFISLIVLCSSVPFAVRILDTKNNVGQTSFSEYMTPSTKIVFYNYYFYDVPFLLQLKQPVYIVNQWDTVHSDSASLEIKDGLLFEPQRKKYLWNEQQLETALTQKQDLIVVSQPHNFVTKNPSVKTLHYRNYDVFIFHNSK
ncbi:MULTISPECIES: glycosyltransferase family 39 protein [Acinetobacter]|uniref:ArnT family glycosyltransferase n=1 Tax=Acinetobacter TaxID=469 RepID=UPI00029C88A6|nr:glycosyltransferase family 39 protein [Acinetobacter sp. WC-141]EKU36848.1 dolichyl-phosphate-mannose-protein mannosyltransferase [Acinetobacter sp. WC-141]